MTYCRNLIEMLDLVEPPEYLFNYFSPRLLSFAKPEYNAVESHRREKKSHAPHECIDSPIVNRVAIPLVSTEDLLMEFRGDAAVSAFKCF